LVSLDDITQCRVVVFSIIIQGSTITPMIEKAKKYEETGY